MRCWKMNQELDTAIYISGIELKGHPNIIQRQRVRARRCPLTTRLYHFSPSSMDVCMCAQSCPTLCNPTDCRSPPGSSVHGVFQARIPEWVAFSYVPFIQCPLVEDCIIFGEYILKECCRKKEKKETRISGREYFKNCFHCTTLCMHLILKYTLEMTKI